MSLSFDDNYFDSSHNVSLSKINKEETRISRNRHISKNILSWNKLKCTNDNELNYMKSDMSDEKNKKLNNSYSNTSSFYEDNDTCIKLSKRSGAASVLYKNFIYIFGGYKSRKRLNDFYKYNIIENKWTKISEEKNYPSERENNPTFLYRNKMYILGGYGGNKNWLNDFYSFDLDTEKWELVDVKEKSKVNAPPPLFGFASSVDEDKGILYLFGGYDGTRLRNEIYAYNVKKNKWVYTNQSGDIPTPRSCMNGHIYDGYFYIFGGYNGTDGLNCLYQYHLKSGIWTKIKYNMTEKILKNRNNTPIDKNSEKNDHYILYNDNIPTPRYFVGSFLHNKCFYILGGYNGYSDRLNDFYRFDINQRIWNKINTSNNFCGRSSMNVHFYKNVVYCIAGYDGKCSLNDIYALKLENVYIEPSSLVENYKMMVNNSRHSDVIFVLQNKYIYGCKAILSARCSSFNSLFNLYASREIGSTYNNVPIPINDVEYDIFLIVINYLYTDQLPINYSLETYKKVLVASVQFNIFRLLQLCEMIISNYINKINVLEITLLSYKNNCKQLCKFCLDFIINNKLLDDNNINKLLIEPHLLGEIYKRSLPN